MDEPLVLIALTRSFARDRPVRLLVVTMHELAHFLHSGWIAVATDPEPDRYVDLRKDDSG